MRTQAPPLCMHMYVCMHPRSHVRVHIHTHTHTHTHTESVQPVLETEHRATSTNITNGTLIHITQWTMTVMKEGHQLQHKIYHRLMIVTLMQDKMTKFTFSIMFTHLQKIRFFRINKQARQKNRAREKYQYGKCEWGAGKTLTLSQTGHEFVAPVYLCVCVCMHECASIHAHMHFSTNTDFRRRFVWDMVPHHLTIGGQSSETALSQTIWH